MTLPIASGKYSDVGYRFRRNHLTREDLPTPFSDTYAKISEAFYDFQFYNQDTYDVSDESDLLAEVYFRL